MLVLYGYAQACSLGLAIVNIDNGVAAGAALIANYVAKVKNLLYLLEFVTLSILSSIQFRL